MIAHTDRWTIGPDAHARFIDLSGDSNPIHTDELVARRLPFGRVAVHGIHLLRRVLDQIARQTGRSPRRIRCTFRHPVGVDDELTTSISVEGDTARATVMVEVWKAADIEVELGGPSGGVDAGRSAPAPASAHDPEVHTIESLEGVSGEIPTGGDELVALTRLVGMHVPGLHSMFSSLDVEVRPVRAAHDALRYRVVTADTRFSRVVIAVDGPCLHGTVTAFVRPAPVEPVIGAARPNSGEFSGQGWLVVGGSRGLGAVGVLLLDAGGAEVRFTYRRGAADARALAARTNGAAGLQYDVDGSITDVLAGWHPTHLAYMATPPIFVGAPGTYSESLYRAFRNVYVDRFLALVHALRPEGLEGVLFPSSTAVDRPAPGMAEYADAKRDGEQVCAELAARYPELRIVVRRLPRLLTDQTTSYVPTDFGDTGLEMLAALQAVTRRAHT